MHIIQHTTVLTNAQLSSIISLIKAGCAVSTIGLVSRINKCTDFWYALSNDDNDIYLGCIAIKQPNKDYVNKLQTTFNVANLQTRFEIGYLSTHVHARKHGIAKQLIVAVLYHVKQHNLKVFLTTRHEYIANIFMSSGFTMQLIDGKFLLTN